MVVAQPPGIMHPLDRQIDFVSGYRQVAPRQDQPLHLLPVGFSASVEFLVRWAQSGSIVHVGAHGVSSLRWEWNGLLETTAARAYHPFAPDIRRTVCSILSIVLSP